MSIGKTRSVTMVVDAPMYNLMGNAGNGIVILMSLYYAYLVARYSNDPNDTYFDEEWKKEGFCIHNIDIPYWNSHDVCLYFDTVASIIIAILSRYLPTTPGMERVNEVVRITIIATFGHGLGHFIGGKKVREGIGHDVAIFFDFFFEESDASFLDVAITVFFGLLFWLGFIKSICSNLRNWAVVGILLATIAGLMPLPRNFAFMYAQTVVLMMDSINELARRKEEKDFAYAWRPFITGIPIVLISFVESTLCSTFVREMFYGHLMYDAFIPLSVGTWYTICYLHLSSHAQNKIKKPPAGVKAE